MAAVVSCHVSKTAVRKLSNYTPVGDDVMQAIEMDDKTPRSSEAVIDIDTIVTPESDASRLGAAKATMDADNAESDRREHKATPPAVNAETILVIQKKKDRCIAAKHFDVAGFSRTLNDLRVGDPWTETITPKQAEILEFELDEYLSEGATE